MAALITPFVDRDVDVCCQNGCSGSLVTLLDDMTLPALVGAGSSPASQMCVLVFDLGIWPHRNRK